MRKHTAQKTFVFTLTYSLNSPNDVQTAERERSRQTHSPALLTCGCGNLPPSETTPP